MSETDAREKENQAIALLRERLVRIYNRLPAEQVNTAIDRALYQFRAAPIRAYVPLMVERLARDELSHRGDN